MTDKTITMSPFRPRLNNTGVIRAFSDYRIAPALNSQISRSLKILSGQRQFQHLLPSLRSMRGIKLPFPLLFGPEWPLRGHWVGCAASRTMIDDAYRKHSGL